jgi:hypothetical protein
MSNLPATIAPQDVITRIRGHAVILDSDLAALYGVPSKRLNEQVRRNKERFPEHFMFQLTDSEWKNLRSQIATASTGRIRSQIATASKRNIRYMPYAFTEHGAIMAANVLNSPRAIEMSIAVVTAFLKLRRMALSVEGLARKVNELEGKYDKQFKVVFDAVRRLMKPPEPTMKRVGGFSNK